MLEESEKVLREGKDCHPATGTPPPLCIWQQRQGTDHIQTLPISEGPLNVALSLLLVQFPTDFAAASVSGTGKRGLSLWLSWTSVPASLSSARPFRKQE